MRRRGREREGGTGWRDRVEGEGGGDIRYNLGFWAGDAIEIFLKQAKGIRHVGISKKNRAQVYFPKPKWE